MNTPNPDDLDVQDMRRLAQGHDAALNDLMERHAEKLFHYLVRCLLARGDWHDSQVLGEGGGDADLPRSTAIARQPERIAGDGEEAQRQAYSVMSLEFRSRRDFFIRPWLIA